MQKNTNSALTSKQSTFVFRVDGYSDIGFGHLQRCLALAQLILKQQAAHIHLLISSESEASLANFKQQLTQISVHRNQTLKQLAQTLPERFTAILDSYLPAAEQDFATLKQLKPQAKYLALDDAGEKLPLVRSGLLTGIINASLGALSQQYPAELMIGSAIGPQYLFLREEFLLHPKWNTSNLRSKSLAITMGGSDPFEQTERLARILLDQAGIQQLKLILGPGYTEHARLQKLVSQHAQIKLFSNPSNLLTLFSQSSLVLTAGGSTVNELAFLQVPMLVLTLTKDQVANSQSVQITGIGACLGHYEQISDQQILQQITQLLADGQKLTNMHEQSKTLMQNVQPSNIVKYLFGA